MLSLLLCCSLLGGDAQTQSKAKPYWGMHIGMLDAKSRPALAHAVGRPCPATVGAIIRDVDKDGPADKAGLKPTDVILKIDKQSLNDAKTTADVFLASKPDQEMELTILTAAPNPAAAPPANHGRNAGPQIVWTRKTVTLTVGTKPADALDDPACPLKFVSATITRAAGADPILSVHAVARQDVMAFEIAADGFDASDAAVKKWSFGGKGHTAATRASMKTGDKETIPFALHGADAVALLKCRLVRVKLANGTMWRPAADKPIEFEAALENSEPLHAKHGAPD